MQLQEPFKLHFGNDVVPLALVLMLTTPFAVAVEAATANGTRKFAMPPITRIPFNTDSEAGTAVPALPALASHTLRSRYSLRLCIRVLKVTAVGGPPGPRAQTLPLRLAA